VRPVYAPALVAWVGGPNFGVSIGIGGGAAAVGWFPLGPREVFVPAYRYSPVYMERVNVTNTVIVNRAVFTNVNVTNVTYVNRGVVGAVTAVPGGAIVAGRPVREVAVVVPREAATRVVVTGYAGVAPQREAVIGVRAGVAAAPPVMIASRTVVTRAVPPPAPVAFEHQRAALQANGGRPLDQEAMQNVQRTAPAPAARPMYRQANAGSAPAPSGGNRPNFERRQQPSNGAPPPQNTAQPNSNRQTPPQNNPASQPNYNRPSQPNPTQPRTETRSEPQATQEQRGNHENNREKQASKQDQRQQDQRQKDRSREKEREKQ
jgi:hypothetical protein